MPKRYIEACPWNDEEILVFCRLTDQIYVLNDRTDEDRCLYQEDGTPLTCSVSDSYMLKKDTVLVLSRGSFKFLIKG